MKFLIALALLTATPATAAPVSATNIAKVAEVAKDVCPAALKVVIETGNTNVGESIALAAQNSGLSPEETLLLLRLCISYQQGVLDGMKLQSST